MYARFHWLNVLLSLLTVLYHAKSSRGGSSSSCGTPRRAATSGRPYGVGNRNSVCIVGFAYGKRCEGWLCGKGFWGCHNPTPGFSVSCGAPQADSVDRPYGVSGNDTN